MTKHAAITEQLTQAVGYLAQGEYGQAVTVAEQALLIEPEAEALLGVLARAYLIEGDMAAAEAITARLRNLPSSPERLEVLVDLALARGELVEARSDVSTAEAEGRIPAWRMAKLKARIAISGGDFGAAKAILAGAIESHPDQPSLSQLLAEAMVASGTASDVRAVLSHIGKPPVNPMIAEHDDHHTPGEASGLGS